MARPTLAGRSNRRAPEHLVAMIAALADPPRSPDLSPGQARQAHMEQARRVADHIWAEAYVAGVGFAASIAQPAPVVIADGADGGGDVLRASIAAAAADYERHMGVPATEVTLPGVVWEMYGANKIFAVGRALNLTPRRRNEPTQVGGDG